MIETYNVIYSPQAVDDLRDIYSYIAFDLMVPETAQNQVNRIRKQIRSLNFMPTRFAPVDWEPWKSMEMHKVPIDNYIAFYLIDSAALTVTVTRILYSGRDIESIAQSDNI